MSEQVQNVTDLPKPRSLKKFAIRALVLATAATVTVVIASKLKSNEDENAETPQA